MIGVMAILAFGIFTVVKKLGAPAQTVQAPQTIVEKVEYVGVLAAAQDIPLGTRLSQDSLSWIDWPAEAVSPALITEKMRPDAKVELENSIVRSPIVEGEPINLVKLVSAGDSGVMAALLSPGMRAVTTRISVDTAAGGFIQPGDRVDVILRESFRVETNDDNQSTGSTVRRERIFAANTLFENVKVLAIDQTFATTPEGGATVIGSTATFELNQSDSELLQEAEGQGDIYLTLRGITRSGARAASAASVARTEEATSSSLTIYRNGQPTRVAIQDK